MRFHVWMFLNDEDGKPVSGADVSVYLAGSDVPAYVFKGEFSSETENVAPQVKTNAMGYFEFWIGDQYETQGYNSNQKFKISFEKIGIIEGFIDYVDVFPGFIEVNEFDTDNIKNKSVSNRLAFLWENHRNDTSHIVHGIEEVDESDDSPKKNKLISNKQLKDIVTKINTDFSSDWGDDAPFGLEKLDTDKQDEKFNKLLNNKLGHYWQKHIEKKFQTGVDSNFLDIHGLRIIDPAKTDNDFNKIVSNAFIRNIYILLNQSLRVKEFSVSKDDWTYYREENRHKIKIIHNLNTLSPIVECFLNNKRVSPQEVEVLDEFSFYLIMPVTLDLNINVSGKGQQLKV